MRGELEAAREQMLRSMPEVEAAGEPLLIQRAHDGLALLGWVSGDHVSLRRHSERSLELARQIGSPISELLPRLRLLLADLMIGAWEEAELRSVEGLGLARRLGQPRGLLGAVAMRGLVCAQRGDLSAAESYVAEAWRGLGDRGAADRNVFLMVELAEAVLALERGDATRAVTAASGLNRQFPGTRVWPLGGAILGEALVATGDAARALAVADQLAGFASQPATYPAGLAAWVEGLARRALGEHDDALACLARATDAFVALGFPFETARARLKQAELATDLGAAREALEVFERLGARRHVDRARRLLQRLGARVPAPKATRAQQVDLGLSARELQVARLVAEGLSTPQIAERLVLSPRTVSTHLDRMYARLGIGSRAALARYVAERGLLNSGTQST